jgi:hypothetical protein
MLTIQAQRVGDHIILHRDELERLLTLARRTEAVTLQLDDDDRPTLGIRRLPGCEAGDCWHEAGDDPPPHHHDDEPG